MKTKPPPPHSIDEYIASFPAPVQTRLGKLRATIRKAAPGAEETIKYLMPTFMLRGNLVYFAAWKKHIGFYGVSAGNNEKLKKDLVDYAGPKGSLQLPFDQPLPIGLITRIVKQRVVENLMRAKAKGKKMKRS